MVSDMLHLREDLFEIDPEETVTVYSQFELRSKIQQSDQLESLMRVIITISSVVMVVAALEGNSNLYNSQIDQCRETTPQNSRTQDVGTSYHTFFEEILYNNITPSIQNGTSWPGHMGTPSVPDCEQVHQFSRSNMVTDGSSSPAVIEDFHIVKEQVHSLVKSHLKSLSQNIDLGEPEEGLS